MTAIYRSLGTLADFLADTPWPIDFYTPEQFDNVYVLDYSLLDFGDTLAAKFWFAIEGELVLGLPGIDEIKAVVGRGDIEGYTFITATFEIGEPSKLTLHNVNFGLRIGASFLRPMRKVASSNGTAQYVPDPNSEYVEFELGELTVTIDSTGKIETSGQVGGVIKLEYPVMIVPTGIIIESAEMFLDLSGDNKCLAFTWTEPNINALLKPLAADFLEQDAPLERTVTLQTIFSPVQEMRLDWQIGAQSRNIVVPGLIKIELPPQSLVSLFIGAGRPGLDRVTLALTVGNTDGIVARSNFSFERPDANSVEENNGRELYNDPEKDDQSLFSLTFAAKKSTTIILLSFDLDTLSLPTFFQQLNDGSNNPLALSPLIFDQTDSLCQPTALQTGGFSSAVWDAYLNIDLDSFGLPFLRNGPDQFIEVYIPDEFTKQLSPSNGNGIKLDLEDEEFEIPVGLRVNIGDSLNIETIFSAKFNWKTFALKLEVGEVIDLWSTQEKFESEFLGLTWRLRGVEDGKTDSGQKKYNYFKFLPQDNYEIQQAPGATIELEYSGISEEPLRFLVKDFKLGPNGISLTGTVTSGPIRLRGIGTKFDFSGSELTIKDNKIQDLELVASGSLPPDLVGDSQVTIFLQFAQQDGGFKLISGGAKIDTSKLLHCKATRFQYQIDELEIGFYDDGKFHLYFLVTGFAQFVLAPGDSSEGALAWLPNIKIELVKCPLAGDVTVLAKHIKFLIELPKPISFNFLGCFEMEIRAFGFLPQADVFDGDAAMQVTGQLKFAAGAGDGVNSRPDYHSLLIGLPAKGEIFPRIYFEKLAINLAIGDAFKLSGSVSFIDRADVKGFEGQGMLAIQGLPSIAAAFSFLRIQRAEDSAWVRAWFIYAEMGQVSFMIPVVKLYIREIGLGFGYRFTLVSIKAADETNDLRELVKELRALSRTQGNLSTLDAWSTDIEKPGQDPRWTIVFRALIAQNSGTEIPIGDWSPVKEEPVSSLFLFDAVVAFRSDLTFFMAVRGWINTNYYDFVKDYEGLRTRPFLSGFVLLSPKQKRFLAHAATNPDGVIGRHPELPEFAIEALKGVEFSATLLIEPGLLHYELGWPNQLRWSMKFGPLNVAFQGGFIFRLSKHELVIGISFEARGSLKIEEKFSAKVVGVSISAEARVAFGARFIGVLDFEDPAGESFFYAAIGLEISIELSIKFWIKFIFVTKDFRLSVGISLTAALEVALPGLAGPGVRGEGTIALKAMGRKLRFGASFSFNEDTVLKTRDRVQKYLNMGIEAEDVGELPGIDPRAGENTRAGDATATMSGEPTPFMAQSMSAEIGITGSPVDADALAPPTEMSTSASIRKFEAPHYIIFLITDKSEQPAYAYFVLIPTTEKISEQTQPNEHPERGFLPVPPDNTAQNGNDFAAKFPADPDKSFTFKQFVPDGSNWQKCPLDTEFEWRANWDAIIATGDDYSNNANEDDEVVGEPNGEKHFRLAEYLKYAFITQDIPKTQDVEPIGDPELPEEDNPLLVEDERIHNPSDNAFEAAVRGAFTQFKGSPYFKKDPNYRYDEVLSAAFAKNTTIYANGGQVASTTDAQKQQEENQRTDQLRGIIVQDIIADLKEYMDAYVNAPDDDNAKSVFLGKSIAFQMGLVFRVTPLQSQNGNPPDSSPNINHQELDDWLPTWLSRVANGDGPTIRQRTEPENNVVAGPRRQIITFNTNNTNFDTNPPQFERVRHYTHTNTVAITWDLKWGNTNTKPKKEDGYTSAQTDPEHHLLHYQVRRRALNSRERERVFTVKPAEVVHREEDGNNGDALQYLKPRFQVVDNFNHESAQEQASLPATGRSYLYTITPIDFAGNAGRPLTVVATRYPSAPPLVPANSELVLRYRVTRDILDPAHTSYDARPSVIQPVQAHVAWTRPKRPKDAPNVPVEAYRLIFRRETTLPIGSYGLDSSTQRPAVKSLPTSNARPLPTDIQITLSRHDMVLPDAGEEDRRLIIEVPVATLREKGILPQDIWQPESWRVFIQAISINDVPSALAPVQLMLRVETAEENETFKDSPKALHRKREERRPAELEWLPRPIQFPMLPPEDMRAINGQAHFPMPDKNAQDDPFKFSGSLDKKILDKVIYQPHPAEIRCIRFRWNQGPSHIPDYPLDLNAGYELHQLDADAHTTEVFDDPQKLTAALRRLQEIQMLPSEDLLLTPGDTWTTDQWEAWYPSALLRRRGKAQFPDGGESQTPYGPWYSWRESILVWPDWPGLTDVASDADAKRIDALHPFLMGLVTTLDENPSNLPNLKTYNVDLQLSPPMQPVDLAGFMNTTAPKSDPYGWGILQRFGLSVSFTLRREFSNELVIKNEVLEIVNQTLTAIKNKRQVWIRRFAISLSDEEFKTLEGDTPKLPDKLITAFSNKQLSLAKKPEIDPGGTPSDTAIWEKEWVIAKTDNTPAYRARKSGQRLTVYELYEFKRELLLPHLYVDVLFQSGQSVSLEKGRPPDTSLLALVQISLRPMVKQIRTYWQTQLTGQAGEEFDLELKIDKNWSLINQSDTATGQFDLKPDDERIKRKISLPINGQTTLLVRTEQRLDASDIKPDDDTISVEKLLVTEEFSTYFTVPVETLATEFANENDDEAKKDVAEQWRNFKRYAEALTKLYGKKNEDKPRILVPHSSVHEITKVLPDFLIWSQRFFDASGTVKTLGEGTDEVTQTDQGPWLVTAYPRVGTPAYASPDESGRLKYDHLIEDKWAHNYRYYIQPYNRYEYLLRSLSQSPALFPEVEDFPDQSQPLIDLQAGGLDVVLDRTYPLGKPTVLSSRRLDPAIIPGQPTPPGSVWEVIVAQHPEQSLAERNQTLARHLSYRQIAFTLLRRFAFENPDWITDFEQAVGDNISDDTYTFDFAHTSPDDQSDDRLPALPDSSPDIIDLKSSLNEEELRNLDLPLRLDRFQQGALVLQWEALPFYYEHRLVLVAQASAVVSPINEIIQRDFEYVSPAYKEKEEPANEEPVDEPDNGLPSDLNNRDKNSVTMEGYDVSWKGCPDKEAVRARGRRVNFPLLPLWASLPKAAQEQWDVENPLNPVVADAGKRKLSSLPDLAVVYQIVETTRGNIETQAEFFFEFARQEEEDAQFAIRQLGQHFQASLADVAISLPDVVATDPYLLHAILLQITEFNLIRNYTFEDIPETRCKFKDINASPKKLVGTLTSADWFHLLLNPIKDLPQANLLSSRAEQTDFVDKWFASRLISTKPNISDETLRAKIEFPEPERFVVVWTGEDVDNALDTLIGQSDPELKEALIDIKNSDQAPPNEKITSALLSPLPTEKDIPRDLRGKLSITDEGLEWSGDVSEFERGALDKFGNKYNGQTYKNNPSALRTAVDELRGKFDKEFSVPYLIPPHPDVFSTDNSPLPLTIEQLPPDEPVNWQLSWKAPITEENKEYLEALRDASGPTPLKNPNAFQTVLNMLIKMAPSEETVSLNKRIAQPKAYRINSSDLDQIKQQINSLLEPLIFPSPIEPNLIWQGPNLGLPSAADLIARLQACGADQGFVDALGELLKDVEDFQHNHLNASFNRPPQTPIPSGLLLGQQYIHCTAPLTETEKSSLQNLFSATTDKATIQKLYDDWRDRQTLDGIYEDWFSQEIISEKPDPADLPDQFDALVDFPDPTGCVLIWRGPMTDSETVLNNLQGDEAFKQAAAQLVKDASGIADEDVTVQGVAPLGLDQVPKLLAQTPAKITFSENGNTYTGLTWHGTLSTAEAVALRAWAQLPDFEQAVEKLITTDISLDIASPPLPRPKNEDLPSLLIHNLQIAFTQLAWVGDLPNPDKPEQMQEIIDDIGQLKIEGDTSFNQDIDNLIITLRSQFLEPIDKRTCVLAVPITDLAPLPRPTQDKLPDLLKEQLTIEKTKITWAGRISSPAQWEALSHLSGDEEFIRAIEQILTDLKGEIQTQFDFDNPIPKRPQEVWDLADKLMIGRAVIRYHGLMTLDEGKTLLGLFNNIPDKKAIKSLHDASLRKGMRDKELKVRTRRGNASPSKLIKLETKSLDISEQE
ncbi:MAG: hypothetical protein B6I38_00020 [Anaerolineaceae bacterium 4572_5.1]|nr:MAG: hypothetical protein B6I38_00020 [Anaerolineaceae bacterium 4572_5.1]